MLHSLLARLDAKTSFVSLLRRYVEYPRDPNDEHVLNLAIHVEANYIVARDKDLLDLNNSRDFRLLYPFLRIVDPLTFLREITHTAEITEKPSDTDTTLPEPEADTENPPHG